MAYAKINSVTNANMAKVSNVAKAAIGKIGSIDAPSAVYSNTKSIDFDGTNDYAVSGSNHSFGFSSGGTIAFWVKTHFTGSEVEGDGNFIAYHNTEQFYIAFNWNGTNHRPYIQHPASGSFFYGDDDVADEEWHHVAFVIDGGGSGTSTTSTIYVDAAVDKTGTRSSTFPESQVEGTIKVGGGWCCGYEALGNIDEIGIWNAALDADAITQIYNSGAPIDLKTDSGNYDNSGDLQHYYRMGDGDTYPTITDNQGSNDLTMTNMASGDIETDVPSA